MFTRPDEGTQSRFASPWGEGVVTVRGGRLIGVDLPTAAGRPVAGDGAGHAGAAADRVAAGHWAEQLAAYFRGERLSWTAQEVGLDDLAVGLFARGVFATLLTVPPAATVSYGDLAEMAGHPRAARAVGTVMACNPIPIVIPCHRVVRSDGSLGGYGGDTALKGHLLAHEREHSPGPGGKL